MGWATASFAQTWPERTQSATTTVPTDTASVAPDSARALPGAIAWADRFLSRNEKADKTSGLFLLPLLYYSPDTRWGLGAAGIYYFKFGNESDTQAATRLSYVKLLADYTQNLQLDVWSSWNVFTAGERYLFKGETRYRQFPDRYYGIGNTTPITNEERYQYDLFTVKMLALRQLRRHVFFGVDYQFTTSYNVEKEPDGQLATGQILGSRGGINSGFGLVFLMDTRDYIVNPTQGLLIEASTYFYDPAFGSEFNFNNYNLIFNTYHTVPGTRGHVLATNLMANFNEGGPSFINLATAGNDDILRGYARNRFRDRHFVGGQVEYRMPVWWRFGLVGFAGLGDVFGQPNDVGWDTVKYSYGGGVRFMVNEKERLNIRFDYGFGRFDSNTFYLYITEAF